MAAQRPSPSSERPRRACAAYEEAQELPGAKRAREETTPTGERDAKRQRCARIVVDATRYAEGMAWVKKHRPRVLGVACKADIVACQLGVRHERWENGQKQGRSPSGDPSMKVAQLLGRSVTTCRRAWHDYVEEKSLSIADDSGARGRKYTKFRRSRELRLALRVWLRERNKNYERTVCRDVVRFMVDRKYLPPSVLGDEKSVKSAVEVVRRYLKKSGFVRGNVKGNKTYREKAHILQQRDAYVDLMTRAVKNRRCVYMDESYIHEHYSRHQDTLFDGEDPEPRERKKGHKGRRYCFIAAILSSDPLIKPEDRKDGDHAELMLDTLDIFQGGRADKKVTKDYHGMFDHDYFYMWMAKLLAMLQKRGIKNCIIVMDNAKYHKKKPDSCPRSSWLKARMVEYAKAQGLDVDNDTLKRVIWSQIQPLADKVLPIICQMAEQAGHRVVFSPPDYSDLQPIELVWAIVKGEVGRQYDHQTTLAIVLNRLQTAFTNFSSTSVEACIAKSIKNLNALKGRVDEEDAEEDEVEDKTPDEECQTDENDSEDEFESNSEDEDAGDSSEEEQDD